MMRRLLGGVVIAGLFATASVARAQEVNLATIGGAEANRAYVRTGAEYGFVATVGYARALRVLDRDLLVSGELTTPWAQPDVSDWGARVGALAPIARFGRWRLAAAVAPTARGTRNELGRMVSVGADLGALGGYYGRPAFVAGELGFDWAASTHVAHGALYRETVYPDARNGWYANGGGNFRYGLQAGASVGSCDLALRVGQLRDVGGAAPLLPFYATLAAGMRW